MEAGESKICSVAHQARNLGEPEIQMKSEGSQPARKSFLQGEAGLFDLFRPG